MKISVVTPSIRPKGLISTQTSLENQKFKDFEWLVELSPRYKSGSDLNGAFNRMLRRARGELIVSLQDYITIDELGLQRFWDAYQENKDTFFTAPVGKLKENAHIKWDWRVHTDKIDWSEWEIDWGAAPLEALRDVGGFDEELDRYWGFDNVSVGLRAGIAGYKFACLPENKAVAIDHDKFEEHPYRKLINSKFHNQRLDEFRRGLKIDYLNATCRCKRNNRK